jgi:hypothetical protein
METEDLLIFPESDAPVYNYFTNEKELIETKQKVKDLEDKLKQFESRMLKLETENSGFSIFPIFEKSNTGHESLRFYNMNAETIKILGNTLLIDEQLFCSNLMQFWNQKTAYEGISFEFLKQFKRVKKFIVEGGSSEREEIILNICLSIIKNNDCEIVVKYDSISDHSKYPRILFTQCFNKEIYRKITIDIKNNLNVVGGQGSYVSATFVNETKKYCDKNNIEFKSNIGL